VRQGKYDFHHGSVQLNSSYCFWWMRLQQQKLIPGLDDPTRGVALCPSDDSPYWPFHEFPNHRNLQTSYGLNPFMSVSNDEIPYLGSRPLRAPLGVCDDYGHRQRKVLGLKNSAEVILMGEIRLGYILNWFAPNTFEGPAAGSEWHDWDWYRHSVKPGRRTGGRSNILWLDGHVTAVNQGKDAANNFANEIYSAAWWSDPPRWTSSPSVSERGKRQWAYLPSID
jgi:prepilin-type processing-associated H-X9-DG protein